MREFSILVLPNDPCSESTLSLGSECRHWQQMTVLATGVALRGLVGLPQIFFSFFDQLIESIVVSIVLPVDSSADHIG